MANILDWITAHWFEASVLVLLLVIVLHAVMLTWNTALAVKRLDLANRLLALIHERLEEQRFRSEQ